jgi:nitrogen fixation protein NifU and related proteins
MSELQGLYQEIILDHCKRPRNFGPLAGAARSAEGYNPLCGDKVRVYVELDGERVARVSFEGAGCAISTASASLLTEAVAGRTVVETRGLFQRVHEMLTSGTAGADADEAALGKLAALGGVREYPMRVKCATLAWHTLQAALDAATREAPVAATPVVSTE